MSDFALTVDIKVTFCFLQIHAMCIGGGKLYSVGSDQSIISWNLENLTLHKRVEVLSVLF